MFPSVGECSRMVKNDFTGPVHHSAGAMEPASSSEDQVLPTLSDWKPVNVITNSNKVKDDDLVKYLTDSANWNHNNQISRKVLEGKFGKISTRLMVSLNTSTIPMTAKCKSRLRQKGTLTLNDMR